MLGILVEMGSLGFRIVLEWHCGLFWVSVGVYLGQCQGNTVLGVQLWSISEH